MGSADLARIALELPPEERLDLARRLVESVVAPASLNQAITDGIRRIEDLASGRVKGLTEEELRAALK
jgi:putative addiction module component (TIGR02574 family)